MTPRRQSLAVREEVRPATAFRHNPEVLEARLAWSVCPEALEYLRKAVVAGVVAALPAMLDPLVLVAFREVPPVGQGDLIRLQRAEVEEEVHRHLV